MKKELAPDTEALEGVVTQPAPPATEVPPATAPAPVVAATAPISAVPASAAVAPVVSTPVSTASTVAAPVAKSPSPAPVVTPENAPDAAPDSRPATAKLPGTTLPLTPVAPPPATSQSETHSAVESGIDNSVPSGLRDLLARVNWLFVATVFLPTLLAVIYYGLWSSDIYVSESRYVLRSPQRQAPIGLNAILQSAGFSRAQDDTYTVQEYIHSRDALLKLEADLGIKGLYSNPSIDLFHRFASIDGDQSFEAFHEYFLKWIELTSDPLSAISTLRVRAFSAEDARAINEYLLQAGEALVNKLNERGRQDLIRFAEREVQAAEERATAATLALSAFRNEQAVFDPARQSAIQLQLVSKLQDELITTRTHLAQVRSLSAQNPQIPALELRQRTLEAAIATENEKVTGGSSSLSDKSADYERLALEREFADRQLGVAMASLEQARNDAMRKQLYLERIAQPGLPDTALEPRRIRAIGSVLILGLVAWGVLAMLVAGVREHQD